MVAEHETATAKQLALSRVRAVTEIKAAIAMAREQQNPGAMIRRLAGDRQVMRVLRPGAQAD